MNIPPQPAEITEAQAAAWRKLSSYHSVAERDPSKENIDLLLKVIRDEKRRIEKLIDALPE